MGHEELVDAEVDLADVLDERQRADQDREAPRGHGEPAATESETQQGRSASYETECCVVLHRDELGQQLHQRPVPRVPAEEHGEPEEQRCTGERDARRVHAMLETAPVAIDTRHHWILRHRGQLGLRSLPGDA